MEPLFASYPQVEYAIAAVQLVLVMLGLGATLTPGDFLQVLRYPRSFAIGMALLAIQRFPEFKDIILPVGLGATVGIASMAAVLVPAMFATGS